MEFGRAKSAIFYPIYIDNVYIKKVIVGATWTDGTYAIRWYDSERWATKIELMLVNTLPNYKDSNKKYYYYIYYNNETNKITFGYENQSNSSDKFYALDIYDCNYKNSRLEITVYCYKDKLTRTFYIDNSFEF